MLKPIWELAKKMCEQKKRRIRNYRPYTPMLLLVSIVLFIGCDSEKENMPGAQPSGPPPNTAPPVKPVISGTKLTVKAASASKSTPTGDPKLVFDGDVTTSWNAGDAAPQWIQLDLGEPTPVSEVLLNIEQTPNGPTTHQVLGGPTPDALKPLGTLLGVTQDGHWLELKAKTDGVRYLKIFTTNSPSWIAWREIEVYK
jgi:F5/8 type C domain